MRIRPNQSPAQRHLAIVADRKPRGAVRHLGHRSELVPSRIRTLKKKGQGSCSASLLNDLLTQITAVFVTIGGGGASNGSGTRTTTRGNYRVADPRHGPGDAGGARPPDATRLGL